MPDSRKNPCYNSHGYRDITAYQAIKAVEREERKKCEQRAAASIRAVKRQLMANGFELIERIALRDIRTGREFR